MYVFTDRDIALPLVKAHERGVKVRLYLDQEQTVYLYSQSRFLVQKGIKARISTNNYIMHNKFAIIDNRILLTGSYNWTFSANHRNDENLMVIDDPDVIARYQNYFEKLWFDKYSAQRTRALYKNAKKDLPITLQSNSNPEPQIININTASKAELVKVLNINKPLAQKIINLRNELNCFKEPKDLLQIPEFTNIDLREWKEEGIVIGMN
jgi:phosphatidylserine/phosphatidylglycerophosphate/cardiolipin synthase-like enzyme